MTARFTKLSLAAALVLASAGCNSPSGTAPGTAGDNKAIPGSAATASKGRSDSTIAPKAAATSAPMADAGSLRAEGGAISNGAGRPSAADTNFAGEASTTGMAPGTSMARPPVQEEPALRAGSVDDNANFKDYLSYLADYMQTGPQSPRKLDVSQRHVIRVVDAAGKGVSNAEVQVSAGEKIIATLRTYADGRTLFHPSAYPGLEQESEFTLAVTKGDNAASVPFKANDSSDWQVNLAAPVAAPAAQLDMAIVLDTTGSMGGEIAKLQNTIATISSRVNALPQQPSVRYGLVAYRDQDEEYTTQLTPFTSDIGSFQSELKRLSALGGGDKPEDLESALSDTVNKLDWKSDDAVRLSFIVTDASAHTDYPQSTPYTTTIKNAAKKGIKLYPIGTSGLESEGEYQLRQIAQWTFAQYLFVTRGGDEASGGGGTASATVDKFREGRLDDVVVDIVKAELDKLGK